MALNEAQQRHLNRLLREFTDLAIPKFTTGADQHGTQLHELSPEWLLNSAIEEAVDQVFYLLTLKERLKEHDGTDRT